MLRSLLKRKKPETADRREWLLREGRITDGVILDTEIDAHGNEIAIYSYSLNGVDFEASEFLTAEQRGERIRYAPGSRVGIRYDQKNQGNSIIE
jgi:hypothetical protein